MHQKNTQIKNTKRAEQNRIAQHNKKNKQSPVKNQIKNSSCCDADDFYLTYIYMFICVTANKKIPTTNNNTHHSKFYRRHDDHATIRQTINKTSQNQKFSSRSFSQIIIFDTSDTQNHKTNLLVFMSTPAHHIPVILRIVL